ncbi:hypothetical protein GGI42DRAFT_316673 [Trichoderma sp. SZMC 28013]
MCLCLIMVSMFNASLCPALPTRYLGRSQLALHVQVPLPLVPISAQTRQHITAEPYFQGLRFPPALCNLGSLHSAHAVINGHRYLGLFPGNPIDHGVTSTTKSIHLSHQFHLSIQHNSLQSSRIPAAIYGAAIQRPLTHKAAS